MASRNINDLYTLTEFIVRKERGVFISPQQFCQSVIDTGQMELFEELFKPYGATQILHDGLRPFKVYQPFTSNSDGSINYQDDYQHILSGVFTVTGSTVNPVNFVQTDEFPDAITNQLRPVNLGNPIAIDSSTGFNLYPQSLQIGAYWYMRRPVIPFLSYTQVDRVITYDPTTSVQIEFEDSYINNIISRGLKYIGMFMDEDKIEQFAMVQEKDTN